MRPTKKQESDKAVTYWAKVYLGRAQADAADILESELDGGTRSDRDKNRLVGKIQGLRDAIRCAESADPDRLLLGL